MNDFIDFPDNIDMAVGAIAPSAEVIIAKGIEWDDDYIHVRPYDSVQELVNHIRSKAVWQNDNCAPVKEGKFSFRTDTNSAPINECNYIAYNNKPYEDKWHFGFITSVNWLSHNSCEVNFKYDVFQECWYTANLLPCFVERMHIAKSDDVIGGNLVPDNLETGPMECYHHDFIDWGKMWIGAYLTEMPRGGTPPGTARLYNGVYNGLISYVIEAENYDQMTSLIDSYDEGNKDAIQLIYMFPNICLNTEDVPTDVSQTFNVTADFGYAPKNNKIYSYPYCYCVADDNAGNSYEYKPELFPQGIYQFTSTGVRNTMPAVYTRPINYAGVQFDNYNHGFSTTSFPLCAWSADTFKAWLAQNKNSLALGVISGTMNTVGGAFKAGAIGSLAGPAGTALGVIGGAGSGIMQIAGTVAQVLDKQAIPNQAKGNINSDSINIALNKCRVDLYGMRPTLKMCKVLDDYWSAFGYPIHEITTPLWNSRATWNYIKTIDCAFTAEAELDILKDFRNLFNKGVTLWHTDNIGNYGLENS